MPAPEACVFCRREDRPITREHVFAHWLVRELHAASLVPNRERAAARPERIARVVARVCADCNAGWMSALEQSFRRLLFDRERRGALQAADRTTLSRWLTKTAVLLAQARGLSLGDVARHPELRRGMPDDLEVYVGRLRQPRQRLDFALDASVDAATVGAAGILVDDLVGHVAPRGSLAARHGTRLWPLRTHTMRWETLPVVSGFATIAAKT